MGMKQSVRSKGMLGGYFMVGLGIYLISEGNVEQGLGTISMGFGILGIRDAQ